MNAETIVKRYAYEHLNLPKNQYCIVGLRGITVYGQVLHFNDNRLDEWNDAICIIKDGYWKAYDGTVDPGLHWAKYPMNSRGTAQIKPGVFYLKRGLHKGKSALIQASDVSVKRDSNKDKIWDDTDLAEKGKFGINYHAATDLKTVGRDSAGCIVPKMLWKDKEWVEHIALIYSSPQNTFPCAIADHITLSLFIGAIS